MYGATKEQWEHFVSLGLTRDLLPVVSNPNAKVSPTSSLHQIGKVPSKYNDQNLIVGIQEWTTKSATEKAISNWSANPDYGICIQTRFLRALDIDVEDETLASDIKETILMFYPTADFRTRPNSSKFLFPFFLEGDYTKRVIKLDTGIIEFLANGQQFIAAGTHPSGSRYELPLTTYPTLTVDEFEELYNHLVLAYEGVSSSIFNKRRRGPDIDIPDNVIDYIKNTQVVTKTMRNGNLCVKCPNEHLHSSDSGPTSTMWMKAGTHGYPHGGFRCLHAHCTELTTNVYLDKIGYYTDDFDKIEVTNNANIYDSLPKGLIRDTAEWIVGTSLQPQPELSLLNTIAFAGAVFGRRYALRDLDTRTNIYTVGIAESGWGKDHSRKKLKKLAKEAGLERYIGHDELKSGQGVPTALSMQPSMLMMLDEFGMLLEAIGNSRADAYMRSTTKIFTQLYSSSNTTYKGGVYADKKKDPIIIEQPNLCIYGTSTLVSYRAALTEEAISTGELNRYIVIDPTNKYPAYNFDAKPNDMDQSIVDRWSRFNDMFDVGDLSGEPTITEVDYSFDRKELLEYQRHMLMTVTDGTSPLYARYAENAIKIAMILAIADQPVTPIVSSTHIEFARIIMDKATTFIRLLMTTSPPKKDQRVIGDNPYNEKIYEFLSTSPKTKREIYRRFKWVDTVVIDRAIDNLVAQGSVKVIEEKTAGRPKITYQVKE